MISIVCHPPPHRGGAAGAAAGGASAARHRLHVLEPRPGRGRHPGPGGPRGAPLSRGVPPAGQVSHRDQNRHAQRTPTFHHLPPPSPPLSLRRVLFYLYGVGPVHRGR